MNFATPFSRIELVINVHAQNHPKYLDLAPLKGKYHVFFTSFVKKSEIIPSVSYKIILEQQEKKSTQFLKGTTRDLF